jgi:hypothetical protein
VALYFLVLKEKNYTLTVTTGEGVTGTPVAGTSKNKKGTAITYSYALQNGYNNLSVTLDGAAIAASGTVTMNANHTLAASATQTFNLTVVRGEHVEGTPASGTYPYAKGASVPYSYTPANGYANLEVKLDGAVVATSGNITMNDHHTLAANLQGANISVNSTPAGAKIYLDNVDSGHTTPYTFNFSTAVTKTVRLRYSCGYKEFSQTVSANLGQTITIDATLVVGIKEDFNIPASSCWGPYYSANWSTGGGSYKYKGAAAKWSTNVYNHSFSGDYTVTVKMNQMIGSTYLSKGIFLGTGTSVNSSIGYLFYVTTSGTYRIYRLNSWNFITNCCSYNLLKDSSSSAITQGLNKWNTLEVIKAGTNYTFKVNTNLLYSFSDATYTPSYCMLTYYCNNITSEVLCDYVYLDSGSGAGSMLGMPVKIMPAADKESLSRSPLPGEM